MDTIVPSLTLGLLEVAKVKPSDPVDYLVSAVACPCPSLPAYCGCHVGQGSWL